MKRYLLFSGYSYYPSGGWRDFKGSFDGLEEALQAGHKCMQQPDPGCTAADGPWCHVVDSATGEKVHEDRLDHEGKIVSRP